MKHTVHIEKLVFGGQGLGRTSEGQVVFVWNALPQEDVEFEIIKKHKHHIEGVATTILSPAKDRIEPRESHWLSSSPWQMMSWENELYFKRAIAAETYSKLGNLIVNPDDIAIATDNNIYGYRNKIEFSFTLLPDNTVSLAFFERGKHKHIPAQGSLLASEAISVAAQEILEWINSVRIPIRSLKSLIVRSAPVHNSSQHTVIAALFIKDKLPFSSYPTLSDTLHGFELYYSTHKSPASVPTELLYSAGQTHLSTTIKNTVLTHSIHSFFQVNIPVFDQTLTDIAAFLDPHEPIIDYYSGVGSISLPLSHNRSGAILIDSNPDAIAYANNNISINHRTGCEAHAVPAENMLDVITGKHTVILDPPRVGLHERVTRRLLLKKPPRIVYLSCGIDTHARDLRLLSEEYTISFLKLYNFFPRTPHIEGLAILDRRS